MQSPAKKQRALRRVSQEKMQQKQSANIIMITFWSQFSSYVLNTILILFLTRPLFEHGLGYSEIKAYAFIGISQATGYLMPILGGTMADRVLGLRRSILIGSLLLALAYLFMMLSEYTIGSYGDTFFLAAMALTPAANSLLIGTASAMVSHIYRKDAIKAKSAMTFYYMSINVGALLATLIAPSLLESHYGPLSIFALSFVGKAIAALNFAYRYGLYDSVVWGQDKEKLSLKAKVHAVGYCIGIYSFTLFAYSYIVIATVIVSIGCVFGIIWFLIKTWALSGPIRTKQFIAALLIIEAIVFFVIYNQMNTTLILFAQKNSFTHIFGFLVSPAHYQLLNPLLIIVLGLQLPRFYQKFPRFSIPYQFASGTLLASTALLILAYAPSYGNGMVASPFIALTYVFITLAELWVSAIGLSMIGLYCDTKTLGFAMGTWYLGCSLSSAFSGRIAQWVSIPDNITSAIQSLVIYQTYYRNMGLMAGVLALFMLFIAYQLHQKYDNTILA